MRAHKARVERWLNTMIVILKYDQILGWDLKTNVWFLIIHIVYYKLSFSIMSNQVNSLMIVI